LSPSDECGEGEHKLFKYIRDNEKEHKDKTTIIYGLDADLIMLSMNHLPISERIYLYRETPHFIQSINSDLLPDESYLIDIPELSKIITTNMNNCVGVEVEVEVEVEVDDVNISNEKVMVKGKPMNRVYDYILLCFFLGNDFMPHFPSINIRTGGIDKMLNAYKATMGPNDLLTDGQKINWRNMRKLVLFLAKSEENNFKQEMKLRDKRENSNMPESTLEEKIKKFEALPTYKRDIEKYINPFNPNWEKRYYKSMFELEIDDVRKHQICVNYLEGLEWTLKYYTTGCPDWRWHYKYNYPPLLSDLIQHVPYFDTEFIKLKEPKPVSEVTQLCYVLPKQSMKMLPSKIYDKVIRDHKHLYNDEFKFQWAFCRYFWESHAVLPEIDIEELEKSVGSV
jgi:5'-3' exonuclease